MAKIMYDAWDRHGVKPSEIFKMDPGELIILKAFYLYKRNA